MFELLLADLDKTFADTGRVTCRGEGRLIELVQRTDIERTLQLLEEERVLEYVGVCASATSASVPKTCHPAYDDVACSPVTSIKSLVLAGAERTEAIAAKARRRIFFNMGARAGLEA